MADLQSLEARVRLIEDRQRVVDRVYAVAHAVDYGDEDRFVDSFTSDGRFLVLLRGSDEPTHVYADHAGLRARIENHTRPPELYHKHIYLNPVVSIDGDAATCDTYFLVFSVHEEEPVLLAFGRDRDRMVRCSDGDWRIIERRAEMEVKSSMPVWTVRSTTPGAAGVAG